MQGRTRLHQFVQRVPNIVRIERAAAGTEVGSHGMGGALGGPVQLEFDRSLERSYLQVGRGGENGSHHDGDKKKKANAERQRCDQFRRAGAPMHGNGSLPIPERFM